ncbi:GreA/GreB family elongation factor [candidate division WOR-3 bacterium]|nr:GreA/GreB family elongation factor [candidate division WOR-3 bacterium]
MEEKITEKIEELKRENKFDQAKEFCENILKTEENRACLRFLADYYKCVKDKKQEEFFLKKLLENEVKKADHAIRLMELKGKTLTMIEYVIDELISEKRDTEADEFFDDLISGEWFKHEKIFHWAERLLNSGKNKTAFEWIIRSLEKYAASNLWEEMEEILVLCWKINPSEDVRKNVLFCLRKRYSDCPHLEYYLEETNINSRKDMAPTLDKIHEFMQYDEGKWVMHDSWGLGRVAEMIPYQDEIIIDFEKKNGHAMNLSGVEKIVYPLPDNHWSVITKTRHEELISRIEKDPVSVVKSYLRSFRGQAHGQDLKKNISKDLDIQDSWWNTTREKLKRDLYIDYTSGGKGGKFSLRAEPKNTDENLEVDFSPEKDPEDQYDQVYAFLGSVKKQGLTEKTLGQIEEYFSALEKKFAKLTPLTKVKYYFLAQEFSKIGVSIGSDIKMPKMSEDDILSVVESNVKNDFREKFVKTIMVFSEDEEKLKRKLFFAKAFGFRDFLSSGRREDYMDMVFQKPYESPEALLWAVEKSLKDYKNPNRPSEVTMTEWLFKTAEKHSTENTERNRKIISASRDVLKNDDYKIIRQAVLGALLPQAKLILNWVSESSLFNQLQESDIRTKLIRIRPEIVVSEELQLTGGDVVYVSKKAYLCKQSQRDKLLYEELPAIVEEIKKAAAQGDLSENFEYHSARAKHGELTARIAQIEKELLGTQIIDEDKIDTEKASLGTAVSLKSGEKERKITLLGPWDSDPDRGVLSYLSPIGEKIIGKKKGDKIQLEGETFEIISVEIAEDLSDKRTEQRRKLIEEDDFRKILETGKAGEEDRREYEDRREN